MPKLIQSLPDFFGASDQPNPGIDGAITSNAISELEFCEWELGSVKIGRIL